MTDCLGEALKHFDSGRQPVPCHGKKPAGRNWQNAWRDRDKLVQFFERNPNANLGLALAGELIDIEWDSPEEKLAFDELFEGEDVPTTPCFDSQRGTHTFFLADPRLLELGRAVINYKYNSAKLGIRIGAGGKAAQTVIPPSTNADGTHREWTVSFDEREPAALPSRVVDRIIDCVEQSETAVAVERNSDTPSESSTADAIDAMLAMKMVDKGDGSRRLFAYACRTVEHDLTDEEAVAAIRGVEKSTPFPKQYSAEEILRRVRDAENATVRGLAEFAICKRNGRTDAANAKRLAGRFGDSIRWCAPQKKWLIWDGNRWAFDDRCQIEARAKEVANHLWTEAANARQS